MSTRIVVIVAWLASSTSARADAPHYCIGEYAEDLSALSPQAREAEQHGASYSYAVRTTATYECVSYGADSNLRKTRQSATAYGTAFGYRHEGGDTLLLTNEHVAEWPTVTDADHAVDGIPAGCKRVADSLKIVDDDHDDYAADDIPLTRVVVDPTLDVAVLRAKANLTILPWRVGKSAALAPRDAVEVKGFPLGEFRATNVGKVVSAYAHDDQGEWSHDDFVVDALLSSGGSGSPVLAVSCKTGELELVGIFHAHYTAASALNVVVAIDQVRDLMTTLKRSPRPREPSVELDAAARKQLADAIRHDPDPPFFGFGSLTASVRTRADGTFVFAVFGSEFPRITSPLFVIEDTPSGASLFGAAGGVYFGSALGLAPYVATDAEADNQALIARTLDWLRRDALAAFDYRQAARTAATSRETYERIAKKKRELAHMLEAQREMAQGMIDLVGHVTGAPANPAVSLADIETRQAVSATK